MILDNSSLPRSRGVRMVAFETFEEWRVFFEVFQQNLKYTGAPNVAIALNAGQEDNGDWKWLTDNSNIPEDYPPWVRGFPVASERGMCLYAYIGENTADDNAWGTTSCSMPLETVVCEVDPADL